MGMALAHKRDPSVPATDVVKKIAASMSEEQLKHFADTPAQGLPEKKASLTATQTFLLSNLLALKF
jgi:hypothetical protein